MNPLFVVPLLVYTLAAALWPEADSMSNLTLWPDQVAVAFAIRER